MPSGPIAQPSDHKPASPFDHRHRLLLFSLRRVPAQPPRRGLRCAGDLIALCMPRSGRIVIHQWREGEKEGGRVSESSLGAQRERSWAEDPSGGHVSKPSALLAETGGEVICEPLSRKATGRHVRFCERTMRGRVRDAVARGTGEAKEIP